MGDSFFPPSFQVTVLENIGDIPRCVKLLGRIACHYRGMHWTALLLSPFATPLSRNNAVRLITQVNLTRLLKTPHNMNQVRAKPSTLLPDYTMARWAMANTLNLALHHNHV